MAVSVRASAGFVANNSGGTVTINWPAGTVAGDLAVAEIDNARPAPPGTGWVTVARNVFSKVVTAADLAAGSFQVKSTLYGIVIFAGAARTGRVTWQNGVRIVAGGAPLFLAWSDAWDNVSEMGSPSGQIGSIVKDFRNAWSSMAVRTGQPAGYVQSTANPPHSISVEIVPTAAPPAPLLSAPAAGEELERTAPITLVWSHQGQGTQEAFRVSVRAVGAPSWSYLTSSGTLSGTLQTISGSQQSATIAASTLTAGTAYEWQVATQENGSFSSYSSTRQFSPQNLPSVTSVTPSFAAGALAGSVSWAASATAGALVAWQLAITPSAQTAPDSPMYLTPVTAGNSTTAGVPPLNWTNGASYKAWVRVRQAGGLWSPWNSGTFTVSWTPPAAPTGVAGTDSRPMVVAAVGIPAGKDLETQVLNGAMRVNYSTNPVPANTTGYAVSGGAGSWSYNTSESEPFNRFTKDAAAAVSTAFYVQSAQTIPDGSIVSMRIKVRVSYAATVTLRNNATAITASATAVPANTWTEIVYNGYVVSGTTFRLAALITSFQPSATFDVKQSLWEVAPAVGPYYDGGTPAADGAEYSWTGTANDSPSLAMPIGEDWEPLSILTAPGTTGAVPYPLAPYGTPVTFRSRSLQIVDGIGIPSAWTISPAVISTDTGAYFVDGGSWLAVTVAEAGPVDYVQGVQVSYGMGADGARVDRSPVQGSRGSLKLDCGTKEAVSALVDWITTREAWTLRWHPETGDDGVDRDAGTQTMSPAKAVSSARPVQALIEDRHVSFDWVER